MKKILFSLVVIILSSISLNSKAQSQKTFNPGYLDFVVNNHNQLFELSCIPSTVEMILKYYNVVDFDFYDLQNEWKNKSDGSFRNFDQKELFGITFSQKFALPRDENFPIDSLFNTIENELKSERMVVISLPSDTGWHMFIICKQTAEGDFVSYSKLGTHTLILRNTKDIVRKSKGTEIMTYRLSKAVQSN